MANRSHYYAIDCRNPVSEAHRIRVPSPELFSRGGSASESIVRINLLCPSCKHVYEYTAGDVRQQVVRRTDKLFGDEPTSVAIGFICGDGGCKSRVIVHVIKKYKREETSAAIARLTNAIFHIRCELGHIPLFDRLKPIQAQEIGPVSLF